MFLGGHFVAGLHVKERQIRVNELFLRAQFLGLVAFGDGSGVITLSIIRHAQRELRVEMVRLLRQNVFQSGDRSVVVAGAESKHRIIVLFLRRGHNALTNPT